MKLNSIYFKAYLNVRYTSLTAPNYSCIGEHCTHGETETLELKTSKNSLFPFYRNSLERNWDQNSHSFKYVHDEKPKRILIVIHKRTRMTKTHKNMERHSYGNVHNENP